MSRASNCTHSEVYATRDGKPRCGECGELLACCDPEDPPPGHCPSCHEDRWAHGLTCDLTPAADPYPARELGDWSRP